MANKTHTVNPPNVDRLLRIALIAVVAFFVLTLGVFLVAQATNNVSLLNDAIYVVAGLSLVLPLLGTLFGIRLARQESKSEDFHTAVPYGRAPNFLVDPAKEAAKRARLQRNIMQHTGIAQAVQQSMKTKVQASQADRQQAVEAATQAGQQGAQAASQAGLQAADQVGQESARAARSW